MENLEIQDESGDKDHFTIIPNYIANHSSAIDQALYFQMKKYAGSKGKCYVSKKTLMEKLQIGNFKLSKSINYLLEHKWIEYVGKTIVQTSGGPQEVDSYKIIDIWKLNSDYYEKLKGASRLEHLKTKGLLDFHKGASRFSQRGANWKDKEDNTTKKITTKKNSIYLEILFYWNSFNIIKHLPDSSLYKNSIIPSISSAIKKWKLYEIKDAIKNYAEIVLNDTYWFKYKWGLDEFLRQKNALSNFLNEKNPKQRYLIAQIPIQKKIDSGPTEQELMEEKLKYQKPLTNAGRLKLKQMMKSRGLV